MKALSIRAPWWWFILHTGKDIENRDWKTSFRGTVLIHASKWWNDDEVCMDIAAMIMMSDQVCDSGVDWRTPLTMQRSGGHIVGAVDIVDCVAESNSPWFFGSYGLKLANPIAFTAPVPCRGRLGLFEVPSELLPYCQSQLRRS